MFEIIPDLYSRDFLFTNIYIGYPVICNIVFGFCRPLVETINAVHGKNIAKYRYWAFYWLIYFILAFSELSFHRNVKTFAYFFMFASYWFFKTLFFLWCTLPNDKNEVEIIASCILQNEGTSPSPPSSPHVSSLRLLEEDRVDDPNKTNNSDDSDKTIVPEKNEDDDFLRKSLLLDQNITTFAQKRMFERRIMKPFENMPPKVFSSSAPVDVGEFKEINDDKRSNIIKQQQTPKNERVLKQAPTSIEEDTEKQTTPIDMNTNSGDTKAIKIICRTDDILTVFLDRKKDSDSSTNRKQQQQRTLKKTFSLFSKHTNNKPLPLQQYFDHSFNK